MKAILLLVACVFGCSSKSSSPSHVFVLNGFDIPVVVTIDSERGKTRLELNPRSQARPKVSGKASIKVTTTSGDLISESEAQLGKGTTKGCYALYNVMGAAAYVNEDVVYGTGFGTATLKRRAGEISEQECYVNYPFVDPPGAITVKSHGPAGDNRSWLHYDGDGSWIVAVNTLLDDTGEWASQSRGKAQRIVRAVVTHDPANTALPAIKSRLTAMQLVVPEPTPGNLLDDGRRRKRR